MENISLDALPGQLFCRGVAVNVLKSTSWGEWVFSKGDLSKDGLQIIPSADLKPCVISPSEVLIEARMEAGVGHISLRVSWTTTGGIRQYEYVGIGDALLGISCALIASCDHQEDIANRTGHIVLVDVDEHVYPGGSTWEKVIESYAKEKKVEIKEYYNGYRGVLVQCGGR